MFSRSGRATLEFITEIREREQDVLRLHGERLGGQDTGVPRRARGGIALGEALQQRQTPLADDAVSGFGDDAIDAADVARFHPDRVIRDVEVGFLWKPVALYLEEEILGPKRLTGAGDSGEQGVKLTVPDLVPCLGTGKTERVRMFCAEDRTVRIVVQHDEFRPPEHDDLRLGRQQHAHGAAQALRPCVDRSERRCRPIQRAHPRAHLASTLEERQIRTARGRALRHVRIMPHGCRSVGSAPRRAWLHGCSAAQMCATQLFLGRRRPCRSPQRTRDTKREQSAVLVVGKPPHLILDEFENLRRYERAERATDIVGEGREEMNLQCEEKQNRREAFTTRTLALVRKMLRSSRIT